MRTASGFQAGPPEPASALVFAILGLFFPILSLVALAQSHRGTAAQILAIVGLVLWVLSILAWVVISASVVSVLR